MKFGGSARERKNILLLGALAVVALSAYFAGVVGPLQRSAVSLTAQVREARERVKALELATANEEVLREQHRQLNDTVASLRRLLPPEDAVPNVIELLSNLASQSTVKIQTIIPLRQPGGPEPPETRPGGAAARPVVFRQVPIEVDAIAGFHQLGAFLSAVESGERPLRVSSLRISGNPKEPKRHHIKLVVWLYVVPSQGDITERSGAGLPSS